VFTVLVSAGRRGESNLWVRCDCDDAATDSAELLDVDDDGFLIMHRTVAGLTGYIGPLTLTLILVH